MGLFLFIPATFTDAGKVLNHLHLGDAVHQLGDTRTEACLYLLIGDGRIFDDIVQQGGGNGFMIETQAEQNIGHGQGMLEKGFTGIALLAVMSALRPVAGLADDVEFRHGISGCRRRQPLLHIQGLLAGGTGLFVSNAYHL